MKDSSLSKGLNYLQRFQKGEKYQLTPQKKKQTRRSMRESSEHEFYRLVNRMHLLLPVSL